MNMQRKPLTAQVNDERYEYDHRMNIGDDNISVRSALTRRERDEMALEQAAAALVFDEETGLVYEGYNRDMADLVCMLKWYTDIDLTPFESEEGRYLLYDIMKSNGAIEKIREIVNEDLADVECIYFDLKSAAQRTFERKHGVGHLLKQTLGALLGSEDIATTLAKAQEANTNLIDMFAALKRDQEVGSSSLYNFAKKNA